MKHDFQDCTRFYAFIALALLIVQYSVMYLDSDMTFPTSEVDILDCGKWVFMGPFHENDTPSITIWHTSQPLLSLRNGCTSRIFNLIENELYKWLDPYSAKPVAVPKFYQLVCRLLLYLEHILTIIIARRVCFGSWTKMFSGEHGEWGLQNSLGLCGHDCSSPGRNFFRESTFPYNMGFRRWQILLPASLPRYSAVRSSFSTAPCASGTIPHAISWSIRRFSGSHIWTKNRDGHQITI